jgi:hypothetical protein
MKYSYRIAALWFIATLAWTAIFTGDMLAWNVGMALLSLPVIAGCAVIGWLYFRKAKVNG